MATCTHCKVTAAWHGGSFTHQYPSCFRVVVAAAPAHGAGSCACAMNVAMAAMYDALPLPVTERGWAGECVRVC
jgi:hypothetical protein